MTRLGNVQRRQLEVEENLLRKVRIEHGVTVRQICERAGCNQSSYLDIELGYSSPVYSKTGKIKPYILKAADMLGEDVFSLFPREFCDIRGELALTNEQLIDCAHIETEEPGGNLYYKEIFSFIEKILSHKEYRVLTMRYIKDLSLGEIGHIMWLSLERTRQIEAHALRKLRYFFQGEDIWKSE